MNSQKSDDIARRAALAGKPESLWIATTETTSFPSVQQGLTVDVAILGGGIVGLTAGLLMKKAGAKVAVLESYRIANGVSGQTTAKLTSNHALIYDYLIRHFGEEQARMYADGNQQAIEKVASLVAEYAIDCDFHRVDAYTFTESDDLVDDVQAEVRAAQKLGLPASFAEQLPLPFPIKAAVDLANQAYFHPRKYLLALARAIDGDGSYIFENSRVIDLDEYKPYVVKTHAGEIRAQHVIDATNTPIFNRGLFFSKMYARRTYLVAARLNAQAPEGMFINAEDPLRTIRSHISNSGENYLLVGGESHRTAYESDTIARYKTIEDYAREHFNVASIDYRWSTQDNQPTDRVPFIGRHSPLSMKLYVATGFKGWGMTHGTLAGMIISDMIQERQNPWAAIYNPNRVSPVTSRSFLRQGLEVARIYLTDYLERKPEKTAKELAPGEAGKITVGNDTVAAYKDEQGNLHAVSAVCKHMGCTVNWNNAEESWDCPCHGSRYDCDGHVCHSPTRQDLPEKAAEEMKEKVAVGKEEGKVG